MKSSIVKLSEQRSYGVSYVVMQKQKKCKIMRLFLSQMTLQEFLMNKMRKNIE